MVHAPLCHLGALKRHGFGGFSRAGGRACMAAGTPGQRRAWAARPSASVIARAEGAQGCVGAVQAAAAAQHAALAAALPPHYAAQYAQYAAEGSLEHLLREGEHADAAQAAALAQARRPH